MFSAKFLGVPTAASGATALDARTVGIEQLQRSSRARSRPRQARTIDEYRRLILSSWKRNESVQLSAGTIKLDWNNYVTMGGTQKTKTKKRRIW